MFVNSYICFQEKRQVCNVIRYVAMVKSIYNIPKNDKNHNKTMKKVLF